MRFLIAAQAQVLLDRVAPADVAWRVRHQIATELLGEIVVLEEKMKDSDKTLRKANTATGTGLLGSAGGRYVRCRAYDLGALADVIVQRRYDADKGFDMEYFVYCRDRPGSRALRSDLAEAHWSFMDQYAEAMIARGPTLTVDEMTATGSMHIVNLPDSDAARVFVFDEPNYKAGAYSEVLVRRWSNMLGRTMWDFTGSIADYRRFLVIGHGKPGVTDARNDLHAENARYVDAGGYRDRLIACGPLLSDDGSEWMGTATMVELPDRVAAEAMLMHSPYARAGLYDSVEVHTWRFGGRPKN